MTDITLNVRGKIIISKDKILMKIPFIEKLLTTRLLVDKDDYGNIFIDRDPVLFGKILNYLKNEQDVFASENSSLESECKYYMVDCCKKQYRYFKTVEEGYLRYDENGDYIYRTGIFYIIIYEGDEIFDEIKDNKIIKKVKLIRKYDPNDYTKCMYGDYVEADYFDKYNKCFIINTDDIDEINDKLYRYEIAT